MGTMTRTIPIVEREDGWEIEWPGGFETVLTAAEALQKVKDADVEISKVSGHNAVTIIEWEATTRVGRAVLEALTGQKPVLEQEGLF